MKKTFTIISMLFVAVVAMAGLFAVAAPADAFSLGCTTCGDYVPTDSYDYYPSYSPDYGYDTYYYDDYYYNYDYGYDYGYDYRYDYDYYDPYYYVDYYYEPPVYTPPVYIPPVYTPPAVPTCTLSASQTNVTAGTSVNLSWTASNATSGTISNVGSVSPSYGSRSVTPQVTTTYVGTFAGQGGTTSCQTTVVVQPKTPPTCTLSVTNIDAASGSATLSWTTNNADSVHISNVGSVNTGSGSRTVQPGNGTTTYVATVNGQGGSATCQATVQMHYQPPQYHTPSCTLTAAPGAITAGSSATLSWTSQHATAMTITNVGSVATVGARSVTPGGTTTYVATVTGQGGSATCQTTVQVNQQPQYHTPSCTLSVTNPNSSTGSATLSWTTNNADSVHITNIGSVHTGSGSRTVFPGNGSTTYVATVTGQGGSATCQATTYVQHESAPWCTITVSSNSVNQGSGAVLQWNTSNNATSFFINNSVGYVNTGSGSRTVFPNSTLTYTGTVQNSNGQTATCQTTVGVFAATNATLYQQPGDQPLAFVSLSQVPYTGFEAGALVTFIFWFAVALWSMAIAYVIMGKQGIQFIAERFFAFSTVAGTYPQETEVHGTREDEYVNGFDHTETEPVVQSQMAPAAAVVADAADMSLREVLESRAHASGILLSPEAVRAAEVLGTDRDDTLQKFGEILNTAVQTLPREDGWILLSSDRFDVLAEKYTAGAPELSSDDLNV